MEYIDLSHTINNGMAVYPGTEAPTIEHPLTIEQDGFAESHLKLFSHVGTHMDAPSHMLMNGTCLETLPVERFMGKGLVMDFSKLSGDVIGIDAVRSYEAHMEEVVFVLLYTGWADRWGEDDYFDEFPTLSVEAATWLAAYPLSGIGVDAISVDNVKTSVFPIHRLFMKKEMVIIENLMNLDQLVNKDFSLCALPLKFDRSDGAPTRVVASVI